MDLQKFISFFKVAITHPTKIGAVLPSGRFARRKILKSIPKNPKVVVEYGAGNGSITRDLLRFLGPSTRLIAIEQNDRFIKDLNAIHDSRLIVIHGDVRSFASRLLEWEPQGVDAVVSGIAFSFLSPAEKDSVIEETFLGLKEGGRFILYQHSLAALSTLKRFFPSVRFATVVRNFPPMLILVATKI